MSAPHAIEGFLRTRLKALRRLAGLTQAQVAELIDVSYGHYQAIELGKRPNVSIRVVGQIADVYGLAVHELFAPEVPKFKLRSKPVPPPHYKRKKK